MWSEVAYMMHSDRHVPRVACNEFKATKVMNAALMVEHLTMASSSVCVTVGGRQGILWTCYISVQRHTVSML